MNNFLLKTKKFLLNTIYYFIIPLVVATFGQMFVYMFYANKYNLNIDNENFNDKLFELDNLAKPIVLSITLGIFILTIIIVKIIRNKKNKK